MSIIVALDPNVLIAANEGDTDSRFALNDMLRRKSEFRLGLDPDASIYFEGFEKIAATIISDELVAKFIKEFCNPDMDYMEIVENAALQPEIYQLLERKACHQPVEPQLIMVAETAPEDSYMLIVDNEYDSVALLTRGSCSVSVVEWLHTKFTALRIVSVSQIWDFMPFFRRSRYPGNENHLDLYLKGEHEYVEYKQPKRVLDDGTQISSTKLTRSIITASMKAVCAFVNTEGGKVFVGVDDEGRVIGVECSYNGRSLNEDEFSRLFSNRLSEFEPTVNRFVKPAILSLANGRKVIVLHVDQGDEDIRYFFNGTAYDRCGPSSPKSL